MAFHRFLKAGLLERPISLYGSGDQTRDFTFIEDVVQLNLRAMEQGGIDGEVFNVGGGNAVSIKEVLSLIEELVQKPLQIHKKERQKGDVQATLSDTKKVKKWLGYVPKTLIREGLEKEYLWVRSVLSLL